jgi:hypothetical protein
MAAVVPIAISILALALSSLVFVDSRRRHRRDLFLNIHEVMISADQYRGRQLLLAGSHDQNSIERLPDEVRANVSRAIAMYDTLGLYMKRGYLVEKDVFDMWGFPARRAWRAAEPFVERRRNAARGQPAYPYFRYLAERAESQRGVTEARLRDV